MFLRIIFRKLELKENKYLLAIVYGIIYFIIVFFIFLFAGVILKKTSIFQNLLISISIGIIMAVVYLIKWEFFKINIKS
jgi:hypothetical protein